MSAWMATVNDSGASKDTLCDASTRSTSLRASHWRLWGLLAIQTHIFRPGSSSCCSALHFVVTLAEVFANLFSSSVPMYWEEEKVDASGSDKVSMDDREL